MTSVVRLLAVASTVASFGLTGVCADAWAQDDGKTVQPDADSKPDAKPDSPPAADNSRPVLTNRKKRRRGKRWWHNLRRIHKEGEYGGVTPGVLQPYSEFTKWTRRTNKTRKRYTPRLTWVGFQQRSDRNARVFLQLTRDVQVSQRVEKGTLVVMLEGARFRLRNTLRKVDMRFFDTALFEMKATRVRARRARKSRPARKSGIEVRITFKNASDAAEGKIGRHQLKDKFHYIYLDFGPPTPVSSKAP